jgi:hypothetical protein
MRVRMLWPSFVLALDRYVSVLEEISVWGRTLCVWKVSHLVEMGCFSDTRRDAELRRAVPVRCDYSGVGPRFFD